MRTNTGRNANGGGLVFGSRADAGATPNASVETEGGQEKLKTYNIHLFSDGTIVFVEDGVVQAPGRARVIEGMQGAVGFDRSPTCAFNHVTAEFQIELSAAGGHSYSPDPLFWSSFVAPSSPPTPPHSGIQIKNVRVTRAGVPIEMGDAYSLDVRVEEDDPSVNPFSLSASVDEQFTSIGSPTNTTASLGDTVQGSSTTTGFGALAPGIPQSLPFPNNPSLPPYYSHVWNWLGEIDRGSCANTFVSWFKPNSIDVAHAAVLLAWGEARANPLLVPLMGQAVYDEFENENLIVPQGLYSYRVHAIDSLGADNFLLSPIAVQVLSEARPQTRLRPPRSPE